MKQNKKGFTLAELLIVIAIIAILIAIAIPTFGGALNNAKIQTDHANMRSAYAMAQTGTLQGVLYAGTEGTVKHEITQGTYIGSKFYFMQDGSLELSANAPANAYRLKATANSDDCKTSIPCKTGVHHVNNCIYLQVNADGTVSVHVG